MPFPLLLAPDSWMCFRSRSYETLTPQPEDSAFRELNISHLCAHCSDAAYVCNYEA